MRIGNFEIPELRLIPTAVAILEDIYKIKKRERIQSKDLAILLGHKYGTETHFYRKVRTLEEYGLLEGKGSFQITELGERLLHPRDEIEKQSARTKSVLNVPLWKEVYDKQGKSPRDDNFWAVLVDITKTDPDTAKGLSSRILKWYQEDIAHISAELINTDKNIEQGTQTQDLRSITTKDNLGMSQSLLPPITEGMEKFLLGKSTIVLPKENMKKEWSKIKKMIDIYMEDSEDLV